MHRTALLLFDSFAASAANTDDDTALSTTASSANLINLVMIEYL